MRSRFHPTPFALAAGLALCSQLALANPILSAATTASADGAIPFTSPFSQPGYASSSSDALGNNNASSFAFASQYGSYAVSSNAVGQGADATARASLLYTLTNTTDVARNYSMSFFIYGGSISASLDPGVTLNVGESLGAAYAARISTGGTERFFSSASIQTNSAGTTFTRTGTDLNPLDDGNDGFYGWSGNSYLIDLGILAAGASIDILAEVSNSASSNVGTYEYTGGGGGYGYGDGYGFGCGGGLIQVLSVSETIEEGPATCPKGRANTFYGDPFGFDGTAGQFDNLVSFSSTVVPTGGDVPEPAALGLVGLALAAAGAASRRRRQGS